MRVFFVVCLLCLLRVAVAQDWSLKLSSHVDSRSWKLTSKADKDEHSLPGATITLYKGSTVVTQMATDANGDFTIMVPPNGEYILTVTSPGCNTKQISVSTMGVPEAVAKDNYKPSFSIIGGFTMAKPFYSIDYTPFQQPLVRVIYFDHGKKFDDDKQHTELALQGVSKVIDAENTLIEQFTSTNKAGDVALAKGDCPLARACYTKAMTIIPGEPYPKEQLEKVGLCLKEKEDADKKAAQDAAAKASADSLAKVQALADKAAADKKAADDKAAKDKAAKDKADAARVAKDKAAADKKAADDKAQQDKAKAAQLAKEKADADKAAKLAAAKPEKEKTKTPPSSTDNTSKPPTSTPKGSGINATPVAPSNASGDGHPEQGKSKYSVPQKLGVDQYKDYITTGDGLFKMKRYAEAKTAYQNALKLRPNDPYATRKLAEIANMPPAK